MLPPASTMRRGPVPGFVLFITPLRLNSQDLNSPECPICKEPYIEFQSNSPESNGMIGEWAVRVDISAGRDGGRRCCGHIFGRRCLERYVKGNEPWQRRCPICRAPWFREIKNNSSAISTPTAGPSPTSTLRPATRDRASRLVRSVLRQCERQRRTGGRRSGDRILDRTHTSTSAPFIQQVLDALGVDDKTDEVKATVEEVEKTLERLYHDLDEVSE